MVKSEQVTIYDWFDIQAEICLLMGIPASDFSSYHNVVGGDYKNLWHVALDNIIPDQMRNDTIVTMYSVDNISYCTKKYGDWVEPFFKAYAQVAAEIDPGDNGFLVRFSW